MSEEIRQENTYWSREIAEILQIGNSTLRKWCQLFESLGYRFIKDKDERRAFTDHDAIAFRHFKELTQGKGIALETAAKAVIERFGEGATQTIAVSAMPEIERYTSAMDTLMQHVEQQERFNRELLQRLDEQQRFIEEKLLKQEEAANERDRTMQLLLKDSLEKKKRKKWWWR